MMVVIERDPGKLVDQIHSHTHIEPVTIDIEGENMRAQFRTLAQNIETKPFGGRDGQRRPERPGHRGKRGRADHQRTPIHHAPSSST
jgi:hypothetical protein